MNSRSDDERRVAEQAADWLRVLENAGQPERTAFSAWLRESPRHVRELLVMSAFDKALDDIDPDRRIDIEKLIAGAGANVISLNAAVTLDSTQDLHGVDTSSEGDSGDARRPARPWFRWAAGIAAIGLTLALAWWWLPDSVLNERSYQTATAEQRTFELEDGSVIYLNARSRVQVDFSPAARDLRLVEGEALFKVQHDATRPFRVHTADAVIQALGTQFNVYRRNEETRISVVEGRVQVLPDDAADAGVTPGGSGRGTDGRPGGATSAALNAGEEAIVARGKTIVKHSAADVTAAVAWRQRRLVFRKDTLADMATEFNRYNSTLRIRVEGESLRQRQFNGVFDADDPETLLEYLANEPGIAFDKQDGELVIRQR